MADILRAGNMKLLLLRGLSQSTFWTRHARQRLLIQLTSMITFRWRLPAFALVQLAIRWRYAASIRCTFPSPSETRKQLQTIRSFP